MTKTNSTHKKSNILQLAVAAVLMTLGLQNAVAQQSSEISADVKSLLEFYEKQIYFTENKGQWSSDIHYRAEFSLGQALATSEGMLVGTYDSAGISARFDQGMREEEAIRQGGFFSEPKVKVKGHGWMLKFVNSSPSMTIESKSKHKDVFNYFSSEASKSKTDAANYQEVWYHNVYTNVDVRYYPSAEGSLEYDMICKPGFNKDNIVLQFDGISKVTKQSDGSLVLETSVGDMTLPAPVAYQKVKGEKKAVTSQYIVTGNNTIKFEIGAFDAAQTLIIDPIALRWATWINSGSSGDNHGHCIWVDPADGAIYVVARVVGTTNNITTGAFDESANGNLETIIGKYLEPSTIGGSGTRVWQTYIGGSGDDNPYAMEQGPDGNLYVTGYTSSSNFPLLGGTAFSGSSIDQRSQAGQNIFIMKINKTGTSIKSSVIGGGGSEGSYDLRINSAGDVIISGNTSSTNLATLYLGSGASNTNNGGSDILLFKINQNLSALSWMKNYGGSANDVATIMVQNSSTGDIFVGGYTLSSNFPTTNPRQSALGGTESGFIQKLKSNGTTAWSSYFKSASSKTTRILCMEFNTLKNRLYFGGITNGLESPSNLSASGVYDNSYNGGTNDFFAASMDTNQTFVASTYIGGALNEVNMMGLNTDLNNDVYIFAYTNSNDFPTTAGALQSANLGSNDKVFLKLSSGLNSLLSSTYYGGAADDYDPVGERGIKFSNCRIYTIVTSRSNNIPLTQGALTTTKSSSTSIYEPGLVVWANPPDLSNNTLTGNQEVCAGGTPTTINGSVPSYILPTLTRNGTTSSYPSLGVSITYQWQSSTDSINWTSISGATSQNLLGSQVGPLFTKTFFRRVIGGDACVIEGAADQIIVVKVIGITGTVTNASCFNANNGSIAAVAANGTAPYTYLWSNGATTSTISNLAPGNYTLTVSDGASCSNTATFTITQPNAFSVVCNTAGTYCVNNGGSISASVSGGTAPFTFAWSNGATTSSISGLGAGTYSVIVTDSKGCSANCSVTLGVPVASCSKTDALCFGGNSGSASVSVSGGASPYTYLWSNGGTTASISGLAAGTYSVTVTASNGCTASCSVTVGQPASAVSAACSKTDVSCFGGNNGSVSVSASGGTSPYTYLWSTGATTASVSGRTAGSYNVTVADANGCSATCSVTVGQPSQALSASCSKTDVLCFGGNTGSASVVAAGGTAPYSYSWSNGSTAASASGLIAGSYSVTVTDARGCAASCSVTVGQPSQALSASCSKTDVLCFGGNTGSASVVAAGGTAPYSYSWSNGSTNASENGLIAGSYSVTVTDARGCTASCSVTVGQPSAALSASCSKTDVLCFGGNTGSASVVAAGGTAPYSYSWSNGSSAASANGLIAGSYSVTVTDNKGCTSSCSVTVGQPSQALSASCSKTDVLCFGGNTGSASVVAAGGTAPYSYSWSNGSTAASANGLIAGSYSVTVTDNKGCTASCSVTLGQPSAALSASCSKTDVLCFGGNTGSSSVVAAGGTAPYSYSWSNGSTTASASGLIAGSYSVTVTDAKGCTASCSVTVGQPSQALSASCSKTDVLCFGGNTGSASVVAAGGTAPYSYSWSNGSTTASASGLIAGSYSVTVTDAKGCTASCSVTVGQPSQALSASCSKTDVLCFGGNTGSASVVAAGGTAPYSYSWSNGSTTASASGLIAGSYSVTVTDAKGCTASCSVTVGQPAAALSGNVSSTVATCTQSNSSATANISGGTQPYSYLWSNGQTGSIASGYAAGSYSVAITDARGCQLSLNFTVIKTNCPPNAVDDYATTLENTPVTVTVVSNDTDVDGNIDPLTVTQISSPSNGTVVLNPNGSFTYTPNANFVGSDQFNYQVCDDGTPLPIQCDQATVFITVTGVPTTIIDSIPEDSLITICMENFVNLQGGISSISICGMPSNGTFTISGNCVTYTPTANWNGTDEMCVISCNANNVCDTTPVTIIVIPVNDPPIANDDYETTQEDVPVTVTVVTNDTDIDGNIDPSTVTVVSQPSNGSVVVNNDGTITYTPSSHFVGSDQFNYQVCDDGTPLPALCDIATVFITVTGVPTTIIDSIPEDSLITICMEDFVNLQGGISSISICGMPSNGTFTISGTCVTYTPTANWNGTDEMCVISCNANNVCDTTPITIIVIPVNDPPIANDDYETTQEDVPVTVTVVTNDTDIDGNIDPSTVTVVSQPSNGTVVVNPNGTITYTPGSHYVGPDQFNYQVCDDGTPLPALCDIATVFITVTGVPTTIIDSIPEDSLITICMEDFVNLQGGISSISICGMPSNGTFTISGTCVTYTPTANWNGTDEMCVISCNANNVCDTTPITIIVIPVNDPPIANDDYETTQEDVPVTVIVVTNDTDIDGNIDPSSVTVVSQPSNGTVVVNPNGTITYTPGSHYVGPDQFNYQVCDDGTPLPALCDIATVFITVTGVPTTIIDSIPEDSFITICMEDFVNLQGGISSISICGMPSNGTFTISGTCVTYTPTANWNGTDEMCVISCNANNVCDTTPITIIVIPVNDPPIANDDSTSTNEDVPVTVVVVTNDTDIDGNIDPNTVTIITPPTNGTAVVNPDGSITYTPNSHFYGQDSLVYQVCDDGTPLPALCDQATVYINVIPVNLPPVAIDDINNTLMNIPVSGNVLTNDHDPDGDNITVTGNTNPSNGTVVVNADGSYTYTPNTGFTGEDQFSYVICDNGVPGPLCDTAIVFIEIIPVTTDNNPPIANHDEAVTLVNVPVGGNVLTNDADPDGDNIILNTTPISGPTNGTVVLNPDGTFIYTPNTDYVGTDVFVYEICDDGVPSLCDQTTVCITILENPNGVDNDPPFAADDAYLTPVNTPVSGDMLDNDFDPNGDPIAVNTTPVSNPANGSVVINSDGTFTYTPNSGYIGPDQFVYEICDNGGQSGQVLCAQGTVYITVYPVIDITVVATDASCFGYSDGSVNLTVIGGVAPFIYVWSNGATTEDLSGVPAGTYSVTVTDAFGLILSGSATVGQPAQVIVSVDANGPTEFCAGGSVTLTANSTSQGTYLWSNGATTQAIVVSASGDYSVVLTDGTGCFGTSAPVSVTVFENPVPVISADGPTEFCDGGSVVLTASEAVMYVWSPGGETTQSISVSASGSYSVWVMDANGCEGTSAPVVVTVYQNPVPVISADGPTTFCSGESVTLTSSEAEGYLWSPNGETTQSITVSTSGVYTVTVFDEFGCRGTSAPAEVVVNSNPVPQVSADGPLTFCEGGSVTLTSSETAGNVWSPNGETTQSIVVSAAGSYFVTVTDENGCVGISNPLEIFVNPNPVPVVTADGPLTFCAGETVVLTSSEAATYVWSPGGELTQSITVSASGDFSVWVMDVNGCEGTSAPVSVVVNNNPDPVVIANGPTEFCMGGSVVLTATDAASYVWSPNGETTQSITVAEAGTYFVTVTDANGCVGVSNPVVVTVNPNPVPEITADGPLTFCEGGQVALIASDAASYVWSPNGETTQTIVVSASGAYSVAVIDANGCSGVSAAVDVVVNPNPVPVISASGPLSFCIGGSVTLTSSASDMYMWMPGGETTQSITVSASGDYSVMVMDANGCEGTSAPVTVTIVAAPVPVVSIDGPATFCEGESVTLISSSATGNVWSPNGETTQSIVVSAAGSYYVTVTENGCVGVSAPVDVVVNPNPTPVVTSDGPLTFCQGGSVTLSSSPAASYLWSPNGETTQSITVADPGLYYVIVFDENGCRGVSAPVAVVVNNNPTPVITPSGPTTFCLGGSVTLTASSASGYLWSNGATTQSITVSTLGNYSVTVTDANGCSGTSAPIQVDVTPSIVVTITASGPTEICEGESVTLTATAPGASSYQWFRNGVAITGATGASITVSDFADYNVVASNQYGCEGNSQIILVKVGEVPNAYAGLDEVICPGESVTLTATGGENFLWSNGATTQSITVSPEEATDYTVSVSNPFCGQTDVDTVSVSVAELPIAAIHASDNPSLGNPVNFTDVSGDNSIVSWFWDFGDGNSAATQNTHHTYDFEDVFTVILTVENQYGCSASDTVEVEVEQIILIPNIITPNNDGFNDALGVKNNGVDDFGITIFNRWGQIVYEREAREINWDGRTNSGVELEEGTYFYILKVNNPNGSMGSWEQTGFITLVR